jgi:hypothetical protein
MYTTQLVHSEAQDSTAEGEKEDSSNVLQQAKVSAGTQRSDRIFE